MHDTEFEDDTDIEDDSAPKRSFDSVGYELWMYHDMQLTVHVG